MLRYKIIFVFFASLIFLRVDGATPRKILLITIDTLRADHLGCYGYKEPTTPNLDRFSRSATLFENAFTAVPMTLPSHTTILSGLYPRNHGIRDNAHFTLTSRPFIQQILKKLGYQTAAFVSGATLSSTFGLNRGFDFYDDEFSGTERKANETTIRAVQWIKKVKAPYFIWVHYFDPHAEYEPPEAFRKRFRSPYDGEIAFVDGQLPELWSAAGDDAVIIIAADHGESLGEHGETTHSVFLYNATLRVPLLLRMPGAKAEVRYDPVSLTDIAPTLSAIAGASGSFDGVSLLTKSPARNLFAESLYAERNFGYAPLFACIRQEKKFIQAPQAEFYDLKADPAEKHNLFSQSKINDWKTALQTYVPNSNPSQSVSRMSPEEEEKLRSLGYVSSSVPKNGIDPKLKIPVIESFRQAMILLKTEQYPQAEKRFREISSTEKENGLAFRYLGDALSGQQKYAEATRAYSDSLARLADPEVEVQLAKAYNRLNQADEAEKTLEKTMKQYPEYLEARFDLAAFYASRQKWDAAFALLQGNSAEFHNQRGILYMQQKQSRPAIGEFQAALKLQEKATYWNNLGNAYQQSGAAIEAENAYSRALEFNPDYEECEANLSFLLVQMHRWEDAAAHLARITNKNQKLFRARFALGFVRENQQKPEEAMSIYRKLLSDAPPDWPERAQVEARVQALTKLP